MTTTITRADGGNVQLMEARLMELYSSLRALHRSNVDLEQALVETPGDLDFMLAVKENLDTIRNQRNLAADMIREMRGRGLSVDLPEDIQAMGLTPKEEKDTLKRLGWTDSDAECLEEEGIYL